MSRGGVPTKPPTFRTIDWGAWVRQSWGDEWHKPDVAYSFSNKREFNDPGKNGGPFTGTSGNG